MPGALSSFFLFLVVRPGAPSSFLFLVAMPGARSSFLFLVVRPGAPSSFLFVVAMPGAPSSFLFLVLPDSHSDQILHSHCHTKLFCYAAPINQKGRSLI